MDGLADRFIDYLLVEKGLSENTITSYSADLGLYLDFLKANGIVNVGDSDTATVLKHLIALRDVGLASRSRARHLITLRGFYRFLVQEKILTVQVRSGHNIKISHDQPADPNPCKGDRTIGAQTSAARDANGPG